MVLNGEANLSDEVLPQGLIFALCELGFDRRACNEANDDGKEEHGTHHGGGIQLAELVTSLKMTPRVHVRISLNPPFNTLVFKKNCNTAI